MPPSAATATTTPGWVGLPGPVVSRSRWWLIAVLAVVATLLPPMAPPATADPGMEAAFVAAANRERAEQGRSSLSTAADLTAVAREHSRRMADRQDLHHNPGLGDDVTGWTKVGENVGRGGSVNTIHAALMASASHRQNLLDGDWTETGMGVVVSDGTVWVTQLFRKPSTTAAPTTADPGADEPTASETDTASDASQPDAAGASGAAQESETPDDVEPGPTIRPLPQDRTTVTLARRSAADEGVSAGELLLELFAASNEA